MISTTATLRRAVDRLMRYIPLVVVVTATILLLLALATGMLTHWWALVLLLPLVALGFWDLFQTSHTLRRLYPLVAHFRWFFEWLRPYMRAYLLDSDTEGRPFSHLQRALIYRRAKDIEGVHAFGTDLDVYAPRHEWINHSIASQDTDHSGFRVLVGANSCARPYSASVLNISALSFGSLSGHAIEALNYGAAAGNFYHDTGEGGVSRHHLSHGGDLVWEIGTGYFGCGTADGRFDPVEFARRAAIEQVKMIEVKLSQGAKPGQGGLLPGPKVSLEIAEVRGVPPGRDVLSPPRSTVHSPHRVRCCCGWPSCGACPVESRWALSCALATAGNFWRS